MKEANNLLNLPLSSDKGGSSRMLAFDLFDRV